MQVGRFPWRREGFFRRKCDRRRIQKFRCQTCRRYFSQQTFAVTYYMKRPDLLLPVAAWMTSGAPLRRIARAFPLDQPGRRPCHPSTVPRVARRIGSQCLLALLEQFQALETLGGPVVADHFETFAGEQENAMGVLTAVDATSGFTYLLEPAWHRQATARARLGPRVAPSPGAYRLSFGRMLDRLIAKVPPGGTLRIVSDDHPAYQRKGCRPHRDVLIRHGVYPNIPGRRRSDPATRASLERDRALFPVDVLHRWFRHVGADHRRQSIAFCRRGEAVLERLSAIVVARNLIQGVSERRADHRTPAMILGVTTRPWTWAELLGARRWPHRVPLTSSVRGVITRSMRDPRGISWPAHRRRRAL
jgi:hypothetical protein